MDLVTLRRELAEKDILQAGSLLIGCTLQLGGRSAQLVEIEVYHGHKDPGSHAFRGETPRTSVMFGPPGHAYVYLSYGVHWMMNLVLRHEAEAGAALFRAAKPMAGIEQMQSARGIISEKALLKGPGNLTKAFGIDGRYYGCDLLDANSPLRLLPRSKTPRLLFDTRVGLAYGKGHDKPWRIIDADNQAYVSVPYGAASASTRIRKSSVIDGRDST